MEDPDSIESMSETASLLPSPTVVTSGRPQRPAIRRIRNSSIRLSHTEPTSLIVRNRDTISTTQQSNNNLQDADEEFQGNCCSDPRSRCHRLIALILMCLLGFGSYFCMDNPAALQVCIYSMTSAGMDRILNKLHVRNRGISILGEVRNVEISRVTQQLLCSKSHDFQAVFALETAKIVGLRPCRGL